MKRLAFAGMICLMAGAASAQMFGLPVGRGVGPMPMGHFGLGAGVHIGEYDDVDVLLYGVRGDFALNENWTLFLDLGMVDIEHADTEPGFQGGFLFNLPVDAPFDVGLRGTIGRVSYSYSESYVDPFYGIQARGKVDSDLTSFTLLFMGTWQFDPAAVYAGLGMSYLDFSSKATTTVSAPWGTERTSSSYSDSETDPFIVVGAMYPLSPDFSIYGELAFIDGVMFGVGGRFEF